jgi:hypothetical protein
VEWRSLMLVEIIMTKLLLSMNLAVIEVAIARKYPTDSRSIFDHQKTKEVQIFWDAKSRFNV